jgi:hypothetical protein
VESKNLCKESLGHLRCCVWVLDQNEVPIFGEFIHSHIDFSLTIGVGKTIDEVHRNVEPNLLTNGQRL